MYSKQPKRTLLWTTVDPQVKAHVQTLISVKGVSLSEYLRQLVLSDLDRRTVITTVFKQQLSEEVTK